MSSEFYNGLICLNHLERSLLNAAMTVGMIVEHVLIGPFFTARWLFKANVMHGVE